MNEKQRTIMICCLAVSLVTSGCGPGQLFGPTPTPTPTIPEGWQTFVSERYNYSIAYPPDWQASEATGEWPANQVASPMASGIDTFYSKNADAANLFDYAWMMVSTHPLDSGETLEKWADRYPTIFLAPVRSLCKEVEPSTKIQVGPETAILFSYFCQSGTLKHKAHTAMLIHNGQGFIVVMWNPPDTDEADLVTFEKFWSSFVFTK